MKKHFVRKYLAVLPTVLALSFGTVQAQDFAAGKIIVKFKANSALAERWLEAGRSGAIPEFSALLGEHTSHGFIGSNTLQAVRKKLSQTLRKASSDQADNLERICVVEFSRPLDAIFAAKKLATAAGVEYAEPMPLQKIFGTPNDPMIDQQYQHRLVKSFESWDFIPQGSSTILAVVDTGVDYNHEDLADVIFTNPGETGTDAKGNDKRTNGIDDDGNGFVDDWHGWDFIGKDGTAQDNDPKPGNAHGTHVAGIAGAVADNAKGGSGIAKNVKILPVKIGQDGQFSSTVANGYEALLYAAAMGASVINCSWGGAGGAIAEQESITAATQLGALIVAAAGNNGSNELFYPASYKGVISVGATDNNDRKASYSNYGAGVDVCAPGSYIISTFPNNRYGSSDGTSMASPVAAGVAALIKLHSPSMSPLQVGEQLKATTDNVDAINPSYIGLMGTGRVNALKAVTVNDAKAMVMSSYSISDANKNGVLEAGEVVEISIKAKNLLAATGEVTAEVSSASSLKPNFTVSTVVAGAFQVNEEKPIPSKFSFLIPTDAPENYQFTLLVYFKESGNIIGRDLITMTIRPTYRTMNGNNITVTLNSAGSIGFNDYPNNAQGVGFSWKGSDNFLFEGALMVASSPTKISNVARGASQDAQDKSFSTVKAIGVDKPGILAAQESLTEYADAGASADAGVSVRQNAYQFDQDGRKDFILMTYNIKNTSNTDFSTMYAGLYFDWDIGPSGQSNLVSFDRTDGFGYVQQTKDTSLPWVGMQLLTGQNLNFFAMDNDGTTADNPGVYDGYTVQEKWKTLSSGIARETSSITDVSTVISAGPISLAKSESTMVAYSLFVGKNLNELRIAAGKAREAAKLTGIAERPQQSYPKFTQLFAPIPNPLQKANGGIIKFGYELAENQYITIEVADIFGRTLATLVNDFKVMGEYRNSLEFDATGLASGWYLVRFISKDGIESVPFTIIR